MDLYKWLCPATMKRALLCLGFLLGTQMYCLADDELDDDDDSEVEAAESVDWKLERDEILKEIKQYVDETVKKMITRDVASKFISTWISKGQQVPILGNFKNLRGDDLKMWKWPIAAPKQTLQEIVEAKSAEITRRVDIELPDSARDNYPIEAQNKYRMYKLGEEVNVVLRSGLGTNTEVSGLFRAITAERIHIGKRYVTRRDLDPDTEACFYKEQNSEKIDEYVRRENELYSARKESRREELKHQELPPEFHKGGYVPDPKKDGASIKTAKDEFWQSRRELHTKVFNTLTQQAKEKLTAIETPKRFAERGYIQAENEEGEVEWMPQAVADAIKAAKEAAEAVNPNHNGEPDDMPPY
jgi:hypothetical protein